MGIRFEIQHVNYIAYLTSFTNSENGKPAPISQLSDLKNFLFFLSHGLNDRRPHLISSGKWSNDIARTAERQFRILKEYPDTGFINSEQSAGILGPLRQYFSSFELYILILPFSKEARRSAADLEFLFRELSIETGDRGLALVPEKPDEFVDIIHPFPPLQAIAANPTASPAIVFWNKGGDVRIESLNSGLDLFRTELVPALRMKNAGKISQILKEQKKSSGTKRILHMSDLHFGLAASSRRRSYLKAHLNTILHEIDRVVITGDLFDSPILEYKNEFNEFRSDVERLTGSEIIVVPGNHDVRKKGIRFFSFGADFAQWAGVKWSPVYVDRAFRTIFFCFNSSEGGNFAKGKISEDQRLELGSIYLAHIAIEPEIKDYLKIALVHHHPYKLDGQDFPTTHYQKFLSYFYKNEDEFLAFENSEEFITWCANQGVSLILHGHKHRPRHTLDTNMITVIGCGSTTGAENTPMSYNVVSLDTATRRWNAEFYQDFKGDGSGFKSQNVSLNFR